MRAVIQSACFPHLHSTCQSECRLCVLGHAAFRRSQAKALSCSEAAQGFSCSERSDQFWKETELTFKFAAMPSPAAELQVQPIVDELAGALADRHRVSLAGPFGQLEMQQMKVATAAEPSASPVCMQAYRCFKSEHLK